MRLHRTTLLALVIAVAVPATASASEIIDRNANNVSLKVAQNGQALVSYTARGKSWNVLAWGAINAVHPTPGGRQVECRLDYSGGSGTYKRDVWKTLKDACRPYDGPDLQWFIARTGTRRLIPLCRTMCVFRPPRTLRGSGPR